MFHSLSPSVGPGNESVGWFQSIEQSEVSQSHIIHGFCRHDLVFSDNIMIKWFVKTSLACHVGDWVALSQHLG